MAIVVEDGTGIPTADSYVSVGRMSSFLTGTVEDTLWTAMTTDQKEAVLKRASSDLDSKFRFYGVRFRKNQGLEWPRSKLIDGAGQGVPAGTIHKVLEEAVIRLAATIVSNGAAASAAFLGASSSGPTSEWSSEAVSMKFDTEAVYKAAEAARKNGSPQNYTYELGTRYMELEILLKPFGVLKGLDYLTNNKSVGI